jgi:hypothetical protein
MASFTFTVTKIQKINGIVYITWSDSSQTEISSVAEAQAIRDSLTEEIDVLKKMGIARYLRLDPNVTNPSLMEGHSITYTDTSNTMVSVS